ncbi:hypothetical protein OAH77_04475 [Flavobacteriaceae bacterium]|nr:hypothetical protein [Flavobacteriaceae bacterium]
MPLAKNYLLIIKSGTKTYSNSVYLYKVSKNKPTKVGEAHRLPNSTAFDYFLQVMRSRTNKTPQELRDMWYEKKLIITEEHL